MDSISKYALIGLLVLTSVCMLFIYIFDSLNNVTVPILVSTFLSALIGYTLNAVGVQHGVDSANHTTKLVAEAQYPMVQKTASDSRIHDAGVIAESDAARSGVTIVKDTTPTSTQ